MASAPEQPEISLREWSLKARIRHENTVSRRYSGSYIRNTSSHPSNFTISSTTSSPACSFKVGIDPSTYSFTAALKALQARSLYNSLECSPEVFALNSKWNEAEKYICNPLSGEFPMECLSAKTLSGRSFRKLANKITVSGPLVYPSTIVEEDIAGSPIPAESLNRDEGTPPPHPTSPSSVSTPSILETALNPSGTETGDSPFSNTKSKSDEQDEVKETKEKKEEAIIDKEDDKIRTREKDEERKWNCLSWVRRRQRNKHKFTTKIACFPHLKAR
ncbi:AP2/ERF and B3 domain-containing transcription repressor TEM1-like [Hibiscus syriacus]|uniref:AP2/ERF and B3 domain-containing transcription repressor TEM1-like n=1 Tax=Hibiscus syriacus TaxID=106335 RepID=A0A6A3BZS7_HIBSY|nr:AP2/ERF and B3 domain-containing transcription repressor TEM1-like [Hibiscus syriacus]